MSAFKRVAQNTGILYIRMAITVFISLYSTRLILDALGVEDFGLYTLVGGLIAMLGFLHSSLAAATQRFMSFAQGTGDKEQVKRIFSMSTLLHIVIALIIVAILELAGYFFFSGLLNIAEDRIEVAYLVYRFMVVSTFFTIISVPYEAVITSHENMLFYAILGIIESLLKLSIALYMAYGTMMLPIGLSIEEGYLEIVFDTFDNLAIYGLMMAVLSILMLLIRRIYCLKNYEECRFNFKEHYDETLFKQFTRFAGWSFLGSASSILTNYGQGFVLNVFFGTAINAAQGIANQLSGQLEAFSSNMMKALNPVIVKREGSEDRAGMLLASMTGSKVSYFLLAIFAVPTMIEIDLVFSLWLIEVPNYVTSFTLLLLARRLITQPFNTLNTAISATGNIKYFQILTSILEFLPLGIASCLFFIGFPPFWLYVVLIFTVIIRTFGITLYLADYVCGLDKLEFIKNIIFPCIACTAISIIIPFSIKEHFEPSFLRLIFVFAAFIVVFSFLTYYLLVNAQEKSAIAKLITPMKLKAFNL